MQRVTMDCQTGQVMTIDLTPEEEAARLAEVEISKEQVRQGHKVETKRQLIKSLAELREMKLNPLVFTSEDIIEKQAEVDRLKGEVT